MKSKIIIIIAAVIIVLLAVAVAPRFAWVPVYYFGKTEKNLPDLADIPQMDEADVHQTICGYRRSQLAEYWGSPDEVDQSRNREIWYIDEDDAFYVWYKYGGDKVIVCGLMSDYPTQKE